MAIAPGLKNTEAPSCTKTCAGMAHTYLFLALQVNLETLRKCHNGQAASSNSKSFLIIIIWLGLLLIIGFQS